MKDSASPNPHESYHDVVGAAVVVVVVVVGIVVVVELNLNLINLSCRRRRRRAILSILLRWVLALEFEENPLLPLITRFWLPREEVCAPELL